MFHFTNFGKKSAESRDELGLEPLFDLLNDIGLPKIPSSLTKNTTDFVKQLAMTKRILWADIFFGVYVAADPKNSSRNTLVLDLPNRQNPFPSEKILEKRLKKVRERARDMFVDEVDEESANFSLAEKIYMSEIMKQMISNGTTDEPSCKSRGPFMLVPEEEIDQTVDKLFDLSGQFYVISKSYQNKTEDMQDIGDDNYMLLDDLQLETDLYVKSVNESLEPKIVWKPFFEEFLKIIDEFDLETEKVLVTNLEYFKQISVILAETEDNLLETAIWWIVVDHCVPYSSKELRKIWHSYVNELTGSSERSWSTFCAENVNDLMGMAVAWLYVNPMFLKDGSSNQVYEMLKNIKTSFSKHVSNVDWMDKRTKQATMEKNRNMRSLIAYPEWLFEEILLNDYYRGMNMSTTRYFENMVQIIRIVNYYELCSLTNKSDSNEPIWRVEPTEVNALHNFQENQIVIPFGILQFPFYGLGLEALNYGAIGTILGHELTHGFDNSGRKFDSKGNMKQWWSNETIMNYADKTTCFIDKYSAYYVPEIDEYIDGELTLGENIADNGGLRQAYDAYQVWKSKHKPEALLPGFSDYTHEQLLFMGYAHMWCESFSTVALRWMLRDSHCPGHVRLKMVLRNSEHFSKAWKCSKGSPMNPVDKCHLW
ncbi:neprilysin-11-like [Copidosoma floridanum]|uniref:neprilysin-11-like n=1 Tax=Copidosoma floridanum TaxID=29053 RepID=UPI0006C95CAF|nr:neprilysin-11-like [Copidosoma floridanum]